MSLLAEALAWHQAGYMPLPVKPDGSKAPAVASWTPYVHKIADVGTIVDLFATDHDGIGLVCGAPSGGLEMLELEGRAAGLLGELAEAFGDHGLGELWQRIDQGYSETTPSGGIHWYYRIDGGAPGNTKLARDENRDVLIETRGQGGFTVVAPSNGRTHPSRGAWAIRSGRTADIPTITTDEREAIHQIASLLDRQPVAERPEQSPSRPRQPGDPLRPGDDFNARASWADILTPHGWTQVTRRGRYATWRRPGKNIGISATTGRADDADRLYVFSSSTAFDPEKPYSKFAAHAVLNHGGDMAAAARQLGADGWGERPTPAPGLTLAPLAASGPLGGQAPTEATAGPSAPDPGRPEVEIDEEAFWASRPVLQHIRTAALSRLVAPWAVLGCVLLRTLGTIPPDVTLPPIVGGKGSLNSIITLVGSSAAGKSSADDCAEDVAVYPKSTRIDAPEDGGSLHTIAIGSGEGIAHQYMRQVAEKDPETKKTVQRWEMVRDSVLFAADEVGGLIAIGDRSGATIVEKLCMAWSGAHIGNANADMGRRVPLGKHHYRFGLWVGAQPLRCEGLLKHGATGLPQRIVWLPAESDELSTTPPAWPGKHPLPAIRWPWHHSITVPDELRQQVLEARVASQRGEAGALDGHALFAREKIAVALAVMEGRSEVSSEDWGLSGVVMAMSDRTRGRVQAALATKARAEQSARAQAEGRALAIRDEVAERGRIEQVMAKILAKVSAAGEEGLSWNAVRKSLSTSQRSLADAARDALEDRGDIEVRVGTWGQGRREGERVFHSPK